MSFSSECYYPRGPTISSKLGYPKWLYSVCMRSRKLARKICKTYGTFLSSKSRNNSLFLLSSKYIAFSKMSLRMDSGNYEPSLKYAVIVFIYFSSSTLLIIAI
jgi:hypothetical protein